jgi:hypothetical protein
MVPARPEVGDIDVTSGVKLLGRNRAAWWHGPFVCLGPHLCSTVIKFTIMSMRSVFNLAFRVTNTTSVEVHLIASPSVPSAATMRWEVTDGLLKPVPRMVTTQPPSLEPTVGDTLWTSKRVSKIDASFVCAKPVLVISNVGATKNLSGFLMQDILYTSPMSVHNGLGSAIAIRKS